MSSSPSTSTRDASQAAAVTVESLQRRLDTRTKPQGSLGSLYKQTLTAAQKDWIRAQPWYTGREIPDQLLFSNGGWRVLPLALMRKFDWPPPELVHAGGDLSLGALLQQQGLLPEAFRMGLAIGADLQLRESAAPRRGVTESGHAAWRDIWAPHQ